MGKKNKYKQNEDPDNNQNKPPENPCQQQPLEKGPKAQIGNVGNVSQTGQRGGRSDQGKQQLLDDGQQKKRSAQLQHSGGDIRGRNDGRSGQPLQERQQFRSEQQKNVHWNKCQQEPRQEGGWEEPPKRQQLFTGQQDEQHRRQGSARSGRPQGGAVGVSQPQHQHFDRSQQGAWGGQKKQIYEDQQRPQPQQEGGCGYKKEAGGGQRHQTAGGANRDRFGAQQQPSRQEGARRCQPGQQQSPPQQDQQQQHQGSGFAAKSAQQPYRQEGARRYQPGQQQSPPQQQQQQQQQQHKGSGFAAVESAQQPYRQEGARRCQPGQQQSPPQQQRQQQRQQQQYQGSGFAAEETAPAYNVVSCAGVQRGTLGRQGTCEVNYLRMNIDKMSDTAYHYDVTITPDRPKKFLRPAFDQCQRQYFSEYVMAFDGSKSCYSVIRLPDKSYDYEVEVMDSGDRQKSFQVQIKETDIPEVELASLRSYHNDRVFDKPMRALQALEVILASNNHALGIRVGRSFYRKPEEFYDLGDGYEMYTGIYQAAILGEVPLLNVDISHKSFPKTQSIIQYMRECGVDPNRSIEDNRVKKTITLFLKGIDIIYTPPAKFGTLPKKYKVFDIGDAPRQITFTLDDGKKTTVIDYFASKGCILQYPYLNCITAGSAIRKISLPMEFCSIAGDQVLNRKDGNMQVSKMIKYSATSTNERKSKIMNLLAHFRHNENLTIRSFGIQFGSNFIKVHFRLLPPPELEYFGGKTARPRDGAWQLADVKFLETSKVNHGHKWAIIYENKGRPINAHSLEDFKKAVQKTGQQLDVKLAQEGEIRGFQNIDWVLQDLAKERYALVIVVLPNYGTSYSSVKQNAELKVGILTQCIKEKTVLRAPKDASVIHNLMLKINAKLNGTNHKVSEEKEAGLKKLLQPIHNVMFMGADVTHPSPDQRHIPSVVGVAASHDAYGACYNMQYRLQKSTLEEIEDMKSITEYHLSIYKSYQNRYPEYIIYYRDGVSDGQFPKIRKDELGGIRRACAQVGCNPKITCLIVVKRHHTRFFPLRQSQRFRDFNNVEPGTVVDQYIVHPNEKQFFLVSHKAIQGTAKPTRYNVIEDDSNFDIDVLQKLSYNLCHMFPRCNRAVSYPAPAYLAHLVAFRGRVYLEGAFRFGNLKDEYKKRSIQSGLMKRNPMYFI